MRKSPVTAKVRLTYKSSKPRVAKVNQKGQVKGLRRGETRIKVTLSNGKKSQLCCQGDVKERMTEKG